MIDPFDRVLLLKNIDNAILTSFRTLNKQNNVISSTLKVIHNKFTPKQLSRHVKNTFKRAAQALYSVSEVESVDDLSDSQDIFETEQLPIIKPQIETKDRQVVKLPKQQVTEYEDKSSDIVDQHINFGYDKAKMDESLLSSMELSPNAGF